MTDLSQLIERLEKAKGPDRELDALIAIKIGGAVRITTGHGTRHQVLWPDNEIAQGGDIEMLPDVPLYTASIDAALTLVPEGWSFEVRASAVGDKGQANVWHYLKEYHAYSQRECASPAIALCIAALRARQGEKA